jgi:NADH:ubiquinone oxidoreductase subunit K
MLSLNWQFIVTSIILDDIYGKICSLMLLVISGGESAIGLALIVSYYKIRGSINLETGLKLIG